MKIIIRKLTMVIGGLTQAKNYAQKLTKTRSHYYPCFNKQAEGSETVT